MRTNTTIVFQLAYFDADTNTQLQPDVLYTVFILAAENYVDLAANNAFHLSLAYSTDDTAHSSSTLSSGAVAGIVIAAVVAALMLAIAAAWLVRRQWSNKAPVGGQGMRWSSQVDALSDSEELQ